MASLFSLFSFATFLDSTKRIFPHSGVFHWFRLLALLFSQSPSFGQQLKRKEDAIPVLAARDRLAVEDAGARAHSRQGLNDERKTLGQIIAGPAVELHPRPVLAGDHAEAVVLDLMQPRLAGRRPRG
jgi:hypothetical protein